VLPRARRAKRGSIYKRASRPRRRGHIGTSTWVRCAMVEMAVTTLAHFARLRAEPALRNIAVSACSKRSDTRLQLSFSALSASSTIRASIGAKAFHTNEWGLLAFALLRRLSAERQLCRAALAVTSRWSTIHEQCSSSRLAAMQWIPVHRFSRICFPAFRRTKRGNAHNLPDAGKSD